MEPMLPKNNSLPLTASPCGRLSRPLSVGSEEAPIEGLASVRHSNGACSFPALRFHEWPCEVRGEGISETRLNYLVLRRVDLLLLTFEPRMIRWFPRSVTFGFFTKGTFHLHAPFSSTSIAQSSIHSRTSFPGPLSIRHCWSRELFVSRFRYCYVLRLLPAHHFPFRFRL